MKKFATIAIGAVATAAAALFAATPVAATDVVAVKPNREVQTSLGVVNVTSNYTNATTSASDVTGLTITVPKTIYADLGKQFYRACLNVDAAKATATNGTLTLSVNGSDVTNSARQIQSAAGRGTISFCYVGARPTASSFIVKVRGVSGDTNTFTVYAGGQLQVETFAFNQ